MIIFFQIAGGLTLLFLGGEALVRGSVAIARHLGVPVLIIGLTLVAMGTSAPELMVSISASLAGHPDIAIGNVVGSNIANILLVLGLSAIIYPVSINYKIKTRDNPAMLAITLLGSFFLWSEKIVTTTEGIILILCAVIYMLYTSLAEYKEKRLLAEIKIEQELPPDLKNWLAIIFVLLGILALTYGASILIEGSSSLARLFGISEAVISLTLVAAGTSAPEIATCVVASYHKNSDIIAGNVVGSNIFNIMFGLGGASVANSLAVSDGFLKLDIWFMIFVTLMLIITFIFSKKINRFTGIVFFVFYIGYIASQFYN